MNSHAIINRNKGAYELAKKRSENAKKTSWKKKNNEIQLETQPER